MIYKADYIVTMCGPPLKDGAIRVEGNIITHAGPFANLQLNRDDEIRELPETIIMPGLINCHTHLELGFARGLFPERESFSMWVSRLLKSQEGIKLHDYENVVRLGIMECLRFGTTTVFDIGNLDIAKRLLPREFIRSIAAREFLGLDPEIGVTNFTQNLGNLIMDAHSLNLPERSRQTIACHAPYSCSKALIRHVIEAGNKFPGPYSMHVAESQEEQEMFTLGTGRLHEFCLRKFPKVPGGQGEDPVTYLYNRNLIPRSSLLAHCNLLNSENTRVLGQCGTSIVHCARSHDFFGHPKFPYDMCYNDGINICFGTDSLATTENLNMFEDLFLFREQYPRVECETILNHATRGGARALGMEHSLGCLKSGYLADFIGISILHDTSSNLYEELIREEHDIKLVVVDGQEVIA